MSALPRIAVVGLGYVGLPLAVALARRYAVSGYDVSAERIAELKRGHDRTGEIEAAGLAAAGLELGAEAEVMTGAEVFIITVPTPVDEHNEPDLGAILAACRAVGEHLTEGGVVVLESTVYPGVTEDVCGPVLEEVSGLRAGRNFFLGYSPERINPGDRVHTVERITKVVAGQTPEVSARLREIYGAVTAEVFVARDIRTAEAAKVIENAQRDVNIAFVNEVTAIFHRLGLSVYDVLEAAGTKWNFLDFKPGLVGGHCIGVDPFYLAFAARQVGHEPEVILAGRRINDNMAGFVADSVAGRLKEPGRILVLGLTFKEDVSDLRNTKVVDMVRALETHGHQVEVHDPLADAAEAEAHCGVRLLTELEDGNYDCLIGAVAHAPYCAFEADDFERLLAPEGLLADLKGIWRGRTLPVGMQYWEL